MTIVLWFILLLWTVAGALVSMDIEKPSSVTRQVLIVVALGPLLWISTLLTMLCDRIGREP